MPAAAVHFSTRRVIDVAALCLVAGLFLYLFRGNRPVMISGEPVAAEGHLLPDSRQYLAFAAAIVSGELLRVGGGVPVPQHLAVRMPGYPAILALGEVLIPGDVATRITVLHAAMGLLTLVGVPLLIRRCCPVVVSGPAVLLVLWGMRVYFPWAITEWASCCLLVWLFAVSVRYWERQTTGGLVALGAVGAALMLMRPALAYVVGVPAVAGWLRARAVGGRGLAAALLPFAPVLLWMAFNVYRLHTFALTPSLGLNLFGVASMIGHAEAEPADAPDLRTLIAEVNGRKRPPPGQRLDLGGGGTREYPRTIERLAGVYRKNVHQVAETSAREHGWGIVRHNSLLLAYGVRAIRRDPWSYAAYVLFGLRSLRSTVPLLVPALVVPLLWLRRGRHRGLAIAAMTMLAIHLLHTLLCAGVEVMLPRYYRLTYYPLLGASVMVIAVLLIPLISRRAPADVSVRRP